MREGRSGGTGEPSTARGAAAPAAGRGAARRAHPTRSAPRPQPCSRPPRLRGASRKSAPHAQAEIDVMVMVEIRSLRLGAPPCGRIQLGVPRVDLPVPKKSRILSSRALKNRAEGTNCAGRRAGRIMGQPAPWRRSRQKGYPNEQRSVRAAQRQLSDFRNPDAGLK